MQVNLVTLEGQVTSSAGEPVPDATVTLFGPGPGHAPGAPASAQASFHTSWTLQVTGFDGDLDGCWERFLAHAGLDISRKKFLKKVEKHNPTLADTGRRLRAECVYLLPEQRLESGGDGPA